jgi:hypothetical protein
MSVLITPGIMGKKCMGGANSMHVKRGISKEI